MKVREVMTTDVVTAQRATPFKELAEAMVDAGVSGIPIVDGDQLVGIVTEADLIPKEAVAGRRRRGLDVLIDALGGGELGWMQKARALRADQLMSSPVETAAPDEDLRTVARRMVEHDRKRLPVVDDGRLVGIVARRDLLRLFHRSDAELADSVRERLADARWVPEDLAASFSVRDGRVSLDGTCEHPSDMRVVEGAIWALPGVVAVEDNLSARSPEPDTGPRSDWTRPGTET
jgi:CBS domain-containing protein